MNTTHTPTPWKIISLHESEAGNPHLLEIGAEDFNGRVLASVDSGTDEDNANADLIVRAVNSYEAMKTLLTDLAAVEGTLTVHCGIVWHEGGEFLNLTDFLQEEETP